MILRPCGHSMRVQVRGFTVAALALDKDSIGNNNLMGLGDGEADIVVVVVLESENVGAHDTGKKMNLGGV